MKTDESISCKLNNKEGSEIMCNTNIKLTKTFKNFFIVAFSMVAFALLSYGYIAHAETSGKCGDNLTWTLSDTGELTISGTGDMYDYNKATFWDRSQVKKIIFDEGIAITRIGNEAFRGCGSLTSVTIPSSVTSIGDNAFGGSSLESINVAYNNRNFISVDGVLYTKDGKTLIFYPPKKDGNPFYIPEGVTSIGAEAFIDCENCRSIFIPSSVQNIGSNAFKSNSIFTIRAPEKFRSQVQVAIITPLAATYNFFGLTWMVESKKVPIEFYKDTKCGKNLTWTFSDKDELTISGTGDMYDYLSEYGSPWDRERVKKVTISEGVTHIGDRAFYGCTGLSYVNIPESMESIGDDAFYNCSGLTSVTISEGVTSIGKEAFLACIGLEYVDIPESMESIGDDAFRDCKDIILMLPYKLYDELKLQQDGELFGVPKERIRRRPPHRTSNLEETDVDDTKDITKTADDAKVTESEKSSSSLTGSTGTYDDASNTSNTNTNSSYFSKTADTIMPSTLFILASLLMLALAGLWVSLRKQRT